MKTILCTIGTSIANGCPELSRFQRQGSAWEDDTATLETQIRERLRRFDLAEAPRRIGASAELNSLHRLGLASGYGMVAYRHGACANAVVLEAP